MSDDQQVVAINARFKTPGEVASDFVLPPFFPRIASANHCLIYGPRGSGKTTLLTMLRQQALREWRGEDAPRYAKDVITYQSVFVRTETTWGAQIAKLMRGIPAPVGQAVTRSLYVTHALRCFTREIHDRMHNGLLYGVAPTAEPDRRKIEAGFASYCGDALSLDMQVPSLAGLSAALSRRQMALMGAASEVARGDRATGELAQDFPYLDADLFSSLGIFADGLQFSGLSETKYALLLDELEILPVHLRDYVFANLRSADGRFLIKMSVSPIEESFVELQQKGSATEGDDFIAVDLTHPHKKTGQKFTSDVLVASAQRAGFDVTSVEELLGEGNFDYASDRTGDAYTHGSRLMNAFERLAKRDRTFSEWLDYEGVDLRTVPGLPETVKARTVRKVRDLVLVRDSFA